MNKNNKYLIIIDSVLLLGIITLAFLFVGYTQPLAIAPIPSESEALLFKLPEIEYLLIDDNSRFDSPDTIFIGEDFELVSGRYFIKFFNGLDGEVREVSLEVDVSLRLKNTEEGTGLFNVGDSALQVDVYDTGSLVDSSIAYIGVSDE